MASQWVSSKAIVSIPLTANLTNISSAEDLNQWIPAQYKDWRTLNPAQREQAAKLYPVYAKVLGDVKMYADKVKEAIKRLASYQHLADKGLPDGNLVNYGYAALELFKVKYLEAKITEYLHGEEIITGYDPNKGRFPNKYQSPREVSVKFAQTLFLGV